MDQSTLRPLHNPLYKIKQSLVIAQCDQMRVIEQTLAPGEFVPWHLHPDTDDCIICLLGAVEIREANPDRVTVLRTPDRYIVAKKQPHSTVNVSDEDCKFLIIQGPGTFAFRALPKLD